MRHLIVLIVFASLVGESATAQSASTETRARRKACGECSPDSAVGVMHRQRMRNRDHNDRLGTLARELTRIRGRLHGDVELSSSDRQRLQRQAQRLESQLAGLGIQFGFDVSDQALQNLKPALAEAARAMDAAAAQARVSAARAFEVTRYHLPGWIGITLAARSSVEERDGNVYWKFFEYPQIVTVEPQSPAERAGIRRGDFLLAYDGQDVRREIAMDRVLQPGRIVRIRLRVQRDDEVREIPVKVAPARTMIVRRWGPGDSEPTPTAPRAPRRAEPWTIAPPDPVLPTIPAMPPTPTPAPLIAMRINGLAGAQMETISPQLGEAIGVERGILVISVAPGVPAYEAGLVDGDVILRANGHEVNSVHELRRLMVKADGDAMRLDVSRKGKVRQVTLRW